MFAMAYPLYLREKARSMRVEKALTIDELAARLALSRSTIYYWVRDIPIARKPGRGFSNEARAKGNRAMQQKYLRVRERAHRNGCHSFHGLCRDPTFRDFVCLYIGEGYKRTRHVVAVGNSDPAAVELAYRWIRAFARNPVRFSLQYHADQDPGQLSAFWGNRLAIDPEQIREQRKSNSNQLTGRIWRNRFGVLTVTANDVRLRAALDAWMDEMRRSWLDSARSGA